MIDLFSDTATQPSEGMWQAMRTARLGDEQRGTDPTVTRLEHRMAHLLGQEAALLMPTATMANQVALTVHCGHGAEVICHQLSHVYHAEGGGIATNARAQVRLIDSDDGTFDGQALRDAVRPDDPHYPRSTVVVVENTCNLAGGTVWHERPFREVVRTCRELDMRLHLDGARLFNASVAVGQGVAHWAALVDSVQVCFSKGLGCPFGAILAGPERFVREARRVKQTFGGALRQAGIVAAAMLYALDNNVDRLVEDHRRLQQLATELGQFPQLTLSRHETNILYFSHATRPPQELREQLEKHGVCVSQSGRRLRICTHLGIQDSDVTSVSAAFHAVFGEPH